MLGCGQGRSAESFCATYDAEKTTFIERYGGGIQQTGDELTDLIGGLVMAGSLVGDMIIMFDKLAAVAPDDIRPDIEAIQDSLERQRDAAGSLDPLAILGTGLTSALTTGGSWQRVSDYITVNCETL